MEIGEMSKEVGREGEEEVLKCINGCRCGD